MKLALVRRKFAATGGAELYLQRLLEALAKRGHEIHLYTESWSGQFTAVQPHPMSVGGCRAKRPLRFAEMVRTEVAKQRFDCVFSLERTVQQDVYRAGDGLHRVWLEHRKQFAPWWKKPFTSLGGFHRNMIALETRTFDPRNTRHVIVNSEMVRREILQHFQFPPERIHLVRNGVDVARFQNGKRDETRARFGVKEDEFLLLFVGSGWERKGLSFVLDAMAQTPRLKLLVVGKGRKPASPANAIFAGPMADVENAYAAADLFVTLPIYEPSANVVAEALAAGLPVVTSVNNGAAEVLEEGVTGSTLHEFWTPESVANVFEHWAQRRTRVQVSSDVFSLERNVAETLSVLELAAKERRV